MNRPLTQSIKSNALRLGFSTVGITQPVLLQEEMEKFQLWLGKKYHAGMKWMEQETGKRKEVECILPGIKSVVSVGMNYYSPVTHPHDPETGKISRYAWGDDYHILLKERLSALLESIKSEAPEIKGKYYVDTGPVMEKVWAARSGIGWMGKHTNVISRAIGSWMFLGELFLDVELEYDQPAVDSCGTCTACIDACPTHAIVEPYVLDSNKCISYLTIEHRDALPAELIPRFQNWIYGCDICQEVCPWNRFQTETSELRFYPRKENISPSLSEIAKISQEEFSRRFKKSPIKRAKQAGLVRNAKAVLESQRTSR